LFQLHIGLLREDSKLRILVVEDEKAQADALVKRLAEDRFTCDLVRSLADAKCAVQSFEYDLVLLDRNLPDGDGLELIQQVLGFKTQPRVLVLSSIGNTDARTAGIGRGADDYLAKPYDYNEMLARIRALLRRAKTKAPILFSVGRLQLNMQENQITCGHEALLLPRREFLILETLMLRAERVTTRKALEDAVYNMDEMVESNTLDAQISRLRRRLLENDSGVKIVPMRGIGYILTAKSGLART
jgi:two-component system, OmpR family, response regulator